jgi:hypothetical protein
MITKLLIFSFVGLGFSAWVKVLNRVFLSPASMQGVPNKISHCLFFFSCFFPSCTMILLSDIFPSCIHECSGTHTHEESRLGFGLIVGLWTQV